MKVADIPQAQADNLVSMIDAYAEKGGHTERQRVQP